MDRREMAREIADAVLSGELAPDPHELEFPEWHRAVAERLGRGEEDGRVRVFRYYLRSKATGADVLNATVEARSLDHARELAAIDAAEFTLYLGYDVVADPADVYLVIDARRLAA